MARGSVVSGFRPIDLVVVHCSDSPDDRREVDAAEIGRWHREKGMRMIGYHEVVCKGGRVEQGRPVDMIGAHCLNWNLHSLGIVWVGRDDCERAQWKALVERVANWCLRYELDPRRQVKGHVELAGGRTCPRIDMAKLRGDVEAEMKRRGPKPAPRT